MAIEAASSQEKQRAMFEQVGARLTALDQVLNVFESRLQADPHEAAKGVFTAVRNNISLIREACCGEGSIADLTRYFSALRAAVRRIESKCIALPVAYSADVTELHSDAQPGVPWLPQDEDRLIRQVAEVTSGERRNDVPTFACSREEMHGFQNQIVEIVEDIHRDIQTINLLIHSTENSSHRSLLPVRHIVTRVGRLFGGGMLRRPAPSQGQELPATVSISPVLSYVQRAAEQVAPSAVVADAPIESPEAIVLREHLADLESDYGTLNVYGIDDPSETCLSPQDKTLNKQYLEAITATKQAVDAQRFTDARGTVLLAQSVLKQMWDRLRAKRAFSSVRDARLLPALKYALAYRPETVTDADLMKYLSDAFTASVRGRLPGECTELQYGAREGFGVFERAYLTRATNLASLELSAADPTGVLSGLALPLPYGCTVTLNVDANGWREKHPHLRFARKGRESEAQLPFVNEACAQVGHRFILPTTNRAINTPAALAAANYLLYRSTEPLDAHCQRIIRSPALRTFRIGARQLLDADAKFFGGSAIRTLIVHNASAAALVELRQKFGTSTRDVISTQDTVAVARAIRGEGPLTLSIDRGQQPAHDVSMEHASATASDVDPDLVSKRRHLLNVLSDRAAALHVSHLASTTPVAYGVSAMETPIDSGVHASEMLSSISDSVSPAPATDGVGVSQTPSPDDPPVSHASADVESPAATALPPDWHYFDTVGQESEQPTATLARDRGGALSHAELRFLASVTDASALHISADAFAALPEIPTCIAQLILPMATSQADLSTLVAHYGDRLFVEIGNGNYQKVSDVPASSLSSGVDTPAADADFFVPMADAAAPVPTSIAPSPTDITPFVSTPLSLPSVHAVVHGATLGNGVHQLRTRPTELERFQQLKIAMRDRRIAALQARLADLDAQRVANDILTDVERTQLRNDLAELRTVLGLSEDETLAEYLQTLGIPVGESIADYLTRVMDESATAHAKEMSNVLTSLSQVEARMRAERSTEAADARNVAENFIHVLNTLDEEFRAITTLLESELGIEPRQSEETTAEYLARARAAFVARGQPMPADLGQLVPRHLDELAARDREMAAVCNHLEMLVGQDIGKRRDSETPVMYLRRAIEALIDASHIAERTMSRPTILDHVSQIDALLARNAELRAAEHAEDLTTLQEQIADLTAQLTAERTDHRTTADALRRTEAELRSGRSQKSAMLERRITGRDRQIAALEERVRKLMEALAVAEQTDIHVDASGKPQIPEQCSFNELVLMVAEYTNVLNESIVYIGDTPLTAYDHELVTRTPTRCLVGTPARFVASDRVPEQIAFIVLSKWPTPEQKATLQRMYPPGSGVQMRIQKDAPRN